MNRPVLRGLLGLGLCASLIGLSSCGGGVGKVVQPKDFTANEALGAPVVCKGAPKLARLYTVDLEADVRGDIEVQMGKGVVVVAYDCTSLRVLANCSVGGGDYEYAGIELKEEVVHLTGGDELKSTLPIGGAKLSAEVKAGRSLDLGLVYVGRRATTVSGVQRSQLKGDCEGATHIMQKANIGAFSMATGSAGKVSAVVDLFAASASGSSSSERTAARKDGSLDACRQSDTSAAKPPKGCGAVTRLELGAILASAEPVKADASKAPGKDGKKPAPEKEVAVEQNACPAGFESSGGLCTNRLDVAHLCKADDEAGCRAQCDKGSAESCTNLGAYIEKHRGKTPTEWTKAKRAAQPFFKKACDLGHVEGCTGLAVALFPDEVNSKETLAQAQEAIAIEKKACLRGSAAACTNTALDLANGSSDDKTMPPNAREGVQWATRGCSLGDGWACEVAAHELWEPRTDLPEAASVKPDPARALALAVRGCDGGGDSVCVTVAEWLVGGKKVPKDTARAVQAARRACTRDPDLCTLVLGDVKKAGDDVALFDIAKNGCEKADPKRKDDPCLVLGDLYTAGTGTAKDPAKARDAWKAGCEAAKSWADKPQNEKVCKRLK
jgi:TPR repeat protein